MDRLKHNVLVTLWLTCWTMMFLISASYVFQRHNPLPEWSGALILPFLFAGAVFMGLAHDIRIRNGWPRKSFF